MNEKINKLAKKLISLRKNVKHTFKSFSTGIYLAYGKKWTLIAHIVVAFFYCIFKVKSALYFAMCAACIGILHLVGRLLYAMNATYCD